LSHFFLCSHWSSVRTWTALAHLLQNQADIFPGFSVDVVPEAATLYHQYGARLPFGQPASRCGQVSESERNLLWECLLNELKRTLETRTVNAALRNPSPRPSIVLCDRGIFDSRAYLSAHRPEHPCAERAVAVAADRTPRVGLGSRVVQADGARVALDARAGGLAGVASGSALWLSGGRTGERRRRKPLTQRCGAQTV
jgi:hypothetical protein